MFTRVKDTIVIPDREKVEHEELCPPHDFETGWALHAGSTSPDDTKPVLFCRMCGDVRVLRVHED